MIFTFKDAVGQIIDYLGANVSGEAERSAIRAVLEAYRELSSYRRWSFYNTFANLNTVAPYSTGTIAYDHTGGTNEREVTLTGGTWPTWAASGALAIDNVTYEVDARISGTVITLKVNANPGSDIAAGTAYNLFQDAYLLPSDCLAIDDLVTPQNTRLLTFEHPHVFLDLYRVFRSPGTPSVFTVLGDTNVRGRMAVKFWPAPDNIYHYFHLYQRMARPLTVHDYSAGTASVTGGSATITGSGTTWLAGHVGSIIRFYDSLNYPTGIAGQYPAVAEATISAFTSTTSLTADSSFSSSLSAVKYVISDPVDLEEGAMLNAFLRGCEKQVARARRMKEYPATQASYNEAVILAMQSDSRYQSIARKAIGSGPYPNTVRTSVG